MEALLAFFSNPHFCRSVLFGWRLNKYQHLLVTAGGLRLNISALWILNANGWMRYPTGAHFESIDTLRMESRQLQQIGLLTRG